MTTLSMNRLDGKVALITGASRGIGLGVAQRLVDEGARVCVTARKPDGLETAVKELGGATHAIGVAGKADDPEHQVAAVARTLETFGRLDVLVNNTGSNPVYGPVLEVDPGAFAKVFEVNVLAATGWLRAARAALEARGEGAVVDVASVAGLGPDRKSVV